MPGARSIKGCYTCRIRKKKCDEQRPVCVNCSSRGILCHGSNFKPDWLGRSQSISREKLKDIPEVRDIRYAAERNYKARRSPWTEYRGKHGAHQARCSTPSGRRALIPEPLAELSITGTIASNIFLSHPRPKASSDSLGMHSLPLDHLWWDAGLKQVAKIWDNRDLDLLVFYFEMVVPNQFYSTENLYDLFLKVLSESELLYNVCLNISSYCRDVPRTGNLKFDETDGAFSEETRERNNMALIAMQNQLSNLVKLHGQELLTAEVRTLASMIEMLSLEVIRSMEGHWEMHQQASRTLLSIINDNNLDVSSNTSTLNGQLQHLFTDQNYVTSYDGRILRLFATVFVWIDIISRATFAPKTFALPGFDYLGLLQSGILQTDKVNGCQNWAMMTIFDIAALEEYKTKAQTSGCLSYPTLIKLGNQVQANLCNRTAELLAQRSSLDGLEADTSLITEMFARAALIYLHVVLSGPYIHIPEIQDAVTEALRAFQEFPPRLILRISWPICIMGCMASFPQEDQIRNIILGAIKSNKVVGTVRKGLRIIEECWSLRRKLNSSQGCDWHTAMESLKMRVLLI
ncbi:fungal-specific transcription factor domain-containing protein [Xylogone sp. PMI_703]|nr:fungal-specific transcription factor domain-containing protein [Xylogone sp. PMI_703]